MIQTIGRAARNANGKVIMYADNTTDSMKKAIEETNRRRKIQDEYNKKNNIIPTTIVKEIHDAISGKETKEMAAKYMKKKIKPTKRERIKLIEKLEKEMREAAKVMDFERAAELRDIVFELKAEE